MTPLRNANAERQARHRERVKEKLRNASISQALRNDEGGAFQRGFNHGMRTIGDMLYRHYRDQAETFRKHISADCVRDEVEGAIGEFLAEEIKLEDFLNMVELAGYARIGEFFSLHCSGSNADAARPEWIRHKNELADKGVT
ncbi:hypothetical protein FOB41_03150 [Agrobacterium pusense]|uniref:Uncharacterized protein n=1 Tax=Agrobacterium pusense TaxID=648995 RepID=A0A6H0ZH94_9HYPH|nr:hypothetical protein [Agrobacterium pusense]QIX20206.1 hypothetical protein FOB41_03150 [Agrobacterium pusense]